MSPVLLQTAEHSRRDWLARSSAKAGSSRTSNSDPVTKARASMTSWRSPPESRSKRLGIGRCVDALQCLFCCAIVLPARGAEHSQCSSASHHHNIQAAI